MKKLLVALAALLPVGLAVNVYAVTQTVTPNAVIATLAPSANTVVNPAVQTPTIPANPDLVFLADTTGSMSGAIDNVRTNANSIMSTIVAANPSAEFAAVQYKDIGDTPPYQVTQNLTANTASVTSAMNTWVASGGGDYPEAQIYALYHLATDVTWRTDANRVVAWFGDAPGHDPSGGVTLAQAIAALVAAHIRVIAVSIGADVGGTAASVSPTAIQPPGDGLDDYGQATQIVNATGGVLLTTTSYSDVASAIEAGLKELPVTVTPVYSGDSHLSVAFSPASLTVASAAVANFKETITLAAGSPYSTTFTGTVTFKLNGATATGYIQTISVTSPAAPQLPYTAGPPRPLPIVPLAVALLGLMTIFGAAIAWSRWVARR